MVFVSTISGATRKMATRVAVDESKLTRSQLMLYLPSKCKQTRQTRVKINSAAVVYVTLAFISIQCCFLYMRCVINWSNEHSDLLAFPSGCNWSCYVENYEDLHHMNASKELAVEHWVNYGREESRDCFCKSMPDDCNWKCYIDKYPDLMNFTKLEAISHYLGNGISEERDCTCPRVFRSKTLEDTAVVCAIVSAEEMYIDEWIDYHLGLGFSHIFIYDNSDEFDLGHGWLGRRTRLQNSVTINHLPGAGMQMLAYKQCLKQYVNPQGHAWVSFLDVDEFLVLKSHTNVVSFLLDHSKQGSVSINWELFSWDGRLQFSPEPVTRRFVGQVSSVENVHVKVIANADAILPGQPENPHFVRLVEGHHELDTDGNEVMDMWMNEARPTDVALVYHYHTKSQKEYIDKRARGRSDLAGSELTFAKTNGEDAARRGDNLYQTQRIDTLAWERLLSFDRKYKVFDSPNRRFQQRDQNKSFRIAICSIVSSQEAYIDEWVDYHLGLGLSNIYLFDASDDFWMRQWGNETSSSVPVEVVHYPGNLADIAFISEAYTECLDRYQYESDAFALMEVNDFFMPPRKLGLDAIHDMLKTESSSVYKIPRVLLGHDDQYVYDPLPVTKRFQLRVEDDNAPSMYPVLLVSAVSLHTNTKVRDILERSLFNYLLFGTWTSRYHSLSTASSELLAYHYIRSIKECKKQRGADSKFCNLAGNVTDTSAWERMQRTTPSYSGFNNFL